MTKKSRLTKIAASLMAMLLVFGLFLSAAPTAYAAQEGTLTIYKLDSRAYDYTDLGLSSDGDAAAGFYYVAGTGGALGSYYAYLAGVGYTIYQIGTIEQVTTTDPATGVTTTEMVYQPVAGLQDTGGTPITSIDSTTDASDIDINLSTGGTLTVAAAQQVTTASGELIFDSTNSSLDDQYVYLVKETTIPSSVASGEDFIISVPLYVDGVWEYDIEAFPKNVATSGSVTKDVTAVSGSPVTGTNKTYNVNVGDSITYSVEVTVPSDYDDDPAATLYYTKFNIVDTPSTYLAINQGSVQVYVNSGIISSGYTATVDSTTGVLTIEFNPLSTISASDVITVTYDATIKSGGVGNALTNDIQVDFTTNTGGGTIIPTPIDPDPVVTVYSYGIKKVDESGDALADADFVLATIDSATGSYVYYIYNTTTETWTTDTDITNATTFSTEAWNPTSPGATTDEAILQFYNLTATDSLGAAIEYYLIETAAPTGYVAPSGYSLKFTVDGTTSASVANTYNSSGTYQADTGYTTQVKNIEDSNDIIGNYLPSTGGTGTLMFLIIGLLLIAGAVVLYVRSRRSDKSAN